MAFEKDILMEFIKKPSEELEQYQKEVQLISNIIDIILKSRNGHVQEEKSPPFQEEKEIEKTYSHKKRGLPKETQAIIQDTIKTHFGNGKAIEELKYICMKACEKAGLPSPSKTTFYYKYKDYENQTKNLEENLEEEPEEMNNKVKVAEVREKLRNHKKGLLHPSGYYPE